MKRSKSTVTSAVKQVFREENGYWKCTASSNCSYKPVNFSSSNFKRHLKSHHFTIYERLGLAEMDDAENDAELPVNRTKKKQRKMVVDSDRQQVLLGTLQLVTMGNLPYSFFDSIPCKTSLKPMHDSADLKVTRKSVPKLVEKGATLARDFMKAEMARSLISLKIDSASRGNRHIFAINCQYNLNGKMVLRNLVAKEMITRQTKQNLEQEIEEAISKFGVDKKQIYSIASDNGRNMVASIKLLRTRLESENEDLIKMITSNAEILSLFDEKGDEPIDIFEDQDDELSDDVIEDDSDTECADDFSRGMDGDEKILAVVNDPYEYEEIVDCTHCAAHTAQLAVWDVVDPYKDRIAKIQKVVLKLRQREYIGNFKSPATSAQKANATRTAPLKSPNATLPPKSNTTRWNSTYVMLKSLLVQKPFFNLLQSKHPEIDFTQHWQFIERFCEAFEPAFVLTVKLQKHHVPLSDFYCYWLECQAQLAKLTSNVLAKRLLKAFQTRFEMLSATMQFKSCLYLDPRFNFLGSKRISTEDKEKVQVFLLRLHRRIDEVEGIRKESTPTPADDENQNELEDYLSAFFEEENIPSGKEYSAEESILSQIKELELREKVPIMPTTVQCDPSVPSTSHETKKTPFDILQHWESQRMIRPAIYRLAKVVLAAPSTQVSVERAFSALKHILTDQRMRLSDKSVEDLMLLKLNSDLLKEVADAMEVEDED